MNRNNEKIRDKKRNLLFDSEAVSPVIATLILIVIAVVAAVAVGYLITGAQENAGSQVTQGTDTATRNIALAGASLLQEVSLGEVQGIAEKDPGLTITVGAGTGNSGRAQLYNKVIDIAASAEIWPETGQGALKSPDPLTGLEYKGRKQAVIQGGDPAATIFEQKIGTGFIVPVANSNSINTLRITKAAASVWYSGNKTLELNYTTLASAYSGISYSDTVATANIDGTISVTGLGVLTLVQRGDLGSTHQRIFSNWLYPGDPNTPSLDTNISNAALSGIKKFNSVPDIINYIRTTDKTLGFIPWNPDASYAPGIVAAQLDNNGWVPATKDNKGLGGKLDAASKTYPAGKGLASDAYYYTQGVPKGDVKVFIDFVLSNDGQQILKNNGWFSP